MKASLSLTRGKAEVVRPEVEGLSSMGQDSGCREGAEAVKIPDRSRTPLVAEQKGKLSDGSANLGTGSDGA